MYIERVRTETQMRSANSCRRENSANGSGAGGLSNSERHQHFVLDGSYLECFLSYLISNVHICRYLLCVCACACVCVCVYMCVLYVQY